MTGVTKKVGQVIAMPRGMPEEKTRELHETPEDGVCDFHNSGCQMQDGGAKEIRKPTSVTMNCTSRSHREALRSEVIIDNLIVRDHGHMQIWEAVRVRLPVQRGAWEVECMRGFKRSRNLK